MKQYIAAFFVTSLLHSCSGKFSVWGNSKIVLRKANSFVCLILERFRTLANPPSANSGHEKLLVFCSVVFGFHVEILSQRKQLCSLASQLHVSAKRWQKAVKTQSLKLNISNFTESELQKKVKSEHVFLNQFLIVNLQIFKAVRNIQRRRTWQKQ